MCIYIYKVGGLLWFLVSVCKESMGKSMCMCNIYIHMYTYSQVSNSGGSVHQDQGSYANKFESLASPPIQTEILNPKL